jgi:geranylgeranyl transferase type-2 subunit alpha
VSQVSESFKRNVYTQETLALISRLLTKNPEYYTVWNYRRRVLGALLEQSRDVAIISKDLRFLVPLMLQYPKCYWIWNYRMWLLTQVEQFTESAMPIWNEELGLVGKMLSRDERNFHGWDYRRHVVSNIERLSVSMAEAEFEYTTKMVQKALQNFSALHYRSRLIPRLLDERGASSAERRQFFEQELDWIQDVLVDPYNSAAWFYHGLLLHTLLPTCPASTKMIQDSTVTDIMRYYSQEIERVMDMLEDFDDCKWIYQALIQYTTELDRYTESPSLDLVHSPRPQLREWIEMLTRLDPMRITRWKNLG